MTERDLSHLPWRKSSRSGGVDDNSSCIEVAAVDAATIAARDSKDPTGPVLTFTRTDWTTFLDTIRHHTAH